MSKEVANPMFKPPTATTILVHLAGQSDELFDGVSDLAQEYGWQLVDPFFSRDMLPRDLPPPKGALTTFLPTDERVQQVLRMGIPVVRLGTSPHPKDYMVPAIVWDHNLYARLAADHFAERGFRSLAYIGHQPWHDRQEMYESFRQRSEENGCSCHLLQLAFGDPGNQPARDKKEEMLVKEVGRFLLSVPRPLGLYAYNDVFAVRVCQICRAIGLTVPEDVAILGIGNNRYPCEAAPVPLSSIGHGHLAKGREGVRLLRKLMDGDSLPKPSIKIPPKGIVERQSTNVLAVADPTVAKALRFIWNHIDQPIAVDDVAIQVAVSRSTLERAFRRCLKRGVAAEVRRKRLENCRRLLRSTDYTLEELAEALHFSSRSYLHNLFSKQFGVTPAAYRKG